MCWTDSMCHCYSVHVTNKTVACICSAHTSEDRAGTSWVWLKPLNHPLVTHAGPEGISGGKAFSDVKPFFFHFTWQPVWIWIIAFTNWTPPCHCPYTALGAGMERNKFYGNAFNKEKNLHKKTTTIPSTKKASESIPSQTGEKKWKVVWAI